MIKIFKRFKFQKADTFVALSRDSSFGARGEIIQCSLGEARNMIVPNGLGYYVPRKEGKPILPKSWQPKVVEKDLKFVDIYPAFSDYEQQTTQSETKQSNLDTRQLLLAVPRLEFVRVPIQPGSNKFYGSVTNQDVQKYLLDEHKIHVEKEVIHVPLDRIKEFGEYQVRISIGEPVDLSLNIRHD
ncbi:hypothetical protein EDD86DRAFT_201169 [Gorgonomyces haynaldii]|nr:hypothetical protein EDD86DRAFT_201169 [Gorgonomyces haynaldii]